MSQQQPRREEFEQSLATKNDKIELSGPVVRQEVQITSFFRVVLNPGSANDH